MRHHGSLDPAHVDGPACRWRRLKAASFATFATLVASFDPSSYVVTSFPRSSTVVDVRSP